MVRYLGKNMRVILSQKLMDKMVVGVIIGVGGEPCRLKMRTAADGLYGIYVHTSGIIWITGIPGWMCVCQDVSADYSKRRVMIMKENDG